MSHKNEPEKHGPHKAQEHGHAKHPVAHPAKHAVHVGDPKLTGENFELIA